MNLDRTNTDLRAIAEGVAAYIGEDDPERVSVDKHGNVTVMLWTVVVNGYAVSIQDIPTRIGDAALLDELSEGVYTP